VQEFAATETRFSTLAKTDPERAVRLAELEQHEVDERWRYYEQLGAIERRQPGTLDGATESADDTGEGEAGP
jgi:hypothetical protein